ncbi:MAG: O-antigen ligase family protein [Candidatus Melainabacteria bacterium]|nr:O-antigen ligase family protein [Candidatus Melainabacteria bacterium]
MNKIIEKLDKYSDEVIKKSILGRFFTFLTTKIQPYFKANKPLLLMLLISICTLFASLSLPQFANDRFGIGFIIIFCFCIFLLNIFSRNITIINFNTLDLLILAFILTAVISTFSSYFFKESFLGLLKYIVLFTSYFVIKITILNSSNKTFINLWCFLFLCTVITALIGLYQYIVGVEPLATWEDPSYENIHTRVYSTLGNPNLLAGYLLLVLPVGIVIPFKLKANIFYKIVFLIGTLLILICLILTGSRGGYLGLIASLLFGLTIYLNYLFNQKSKLKVGSILFILFVLLAVFHLLLTYVFPVFAERIATIFTLREHSSNSYRINVWLACLKMLKDNWLIGIGPGNNAFRLAYGLYMISGFDALGAYNIFLEFAIECGFIGCLLFVLIFLTSFLKLHYIFWEKGGVLSLGIFISLIALLTHGMADTVFFRPQIFIPFWFLLASIGKLETSENVRKG